MNGYRSVLLTNDDSITVTNLTFPVPRVFHATCSVNGDEIPFGVSLLNELRKVGKDWGL